MDAARGRAEPGMANPGRSVRPARGTKAQRAALRGGCRSRGLLRGQRNGPLTRPHVLRSLKLPAAWRAEPLRSNISPLRRQSCPAWRAEPLQSRYIQPCASSQPLRPPRPAARPACDRSRSSSQRGSTYRSGNLSRLPATGFSPYPSQYSRRPFCASPRHRPVR